MTEELVNVATITSQSTIDAGFTPATIPEWVPIRFDLPAIPLTDPVLVFALAMAAFFVGPLVIKRLGQPGIVGIILLGAILGPGGVGVVDHVDAIELLGTVGLIYLLFTVGLELDLRGLQERPEAAALFGLLSFFLPFGVGMIVGIEVLGLEPWAAVLLAAVFSSHTLLAYPIVNRYGVTRNDAVTAVFGGILFTDTLALVTLAVAVDAAAGALTVGLLAEIAVSLVLLFGGLWLVVPPVSRWFFRSFDEESYFEFLYVMVVVFAGAGLAEIFGLAAILGAFVAGIALNRLVPDTGPLRNRIEFVGNALFIPFFLIHVGMLVDLGVILEGPSTILITAVIVGVMFPMKGVAAVAFGRVRNHDANEIGTVFGLSIGQAAAALAITLVGFEAGLFGEEILNAVVLLLLVTAVASPLVTKRYGRRLAAATAVDEGDGRVEDPTVLLPLSYYADRQRHLLELAFLFKADETSKPVHVLTVVRPDDRNTERTVAEVRAEHEEIAEVGAEADVPVETETRVNHNPASGIVRGSIEVEADLLLMGWDATKPSIGQRLFGTVIDRVLQRTRIPVLVARLGNPISTTKRMYVVLPETLDNHEGFFEALHFVKKVGDRSGAELTVVSVGTSDREWDRLYELTEPEVPAEFESVDTWHELYEFLDAQSDEDDLIAAITPRKGSLGWIDAFENLPSKLADHPPETFIVVHPREGDPQYDRQFLRFE